MDDSSVAVILAHLQSIHDSVVGFHRLSTLEEDVGGISFGG